MSFEPIMGGKFDSIFIINAFIYIFEKGISWKGRFIYSNSAFLSIKVTYEVKGRQYFIEFRDSYQILPASLAKLAMRFNVD